MIRFFLDNSDKSDEARISRFLFKANEFRESQSLKMVIEILEDASGLKCDDYKSVKDFLQEFNSRSGERQVGNSKSVKVNDILAPYIESLYNAFYELGFISVNKPAFDYGSYGLIIVLGGGNDANLNRMKKAQREVACMKNVDKVVALSTYRMLGENELRKTQLYTEEKNEFGVITDCMSQVFNLGSDVDIVYDNITDDPTTSSRIVRFKNKYKERITLESYAAPKGNVGRTRADTRDTYEFFFEHNNIPEHTTILLVSSNIYPVQQIPFIDFAIKKRLNVDLVGNWEDNELTSVDEFSPSAYINELYKMLLELEKLEMRLDSIDK